MLLHAMVAHDIIGVESGQLSNQWVQSSVVESGQLSTDPCIICDIYEDQEGHNSV